MRWSWLALAIAAAAACGKKAEAPGRGSAAAAGPLDANPYAKGDEYIPAEFKAGAERWRDPGVYLDGKPIGMLTWAELPRSLQPVWIKDKASDNIRPGSKDPGWKWVEERRYRWTDYLVSLGVSLDEVKELHVYGPKFTGTIVVTGKELRSKQAALFQFRFANQLSGKPIPSVPPAFGNRQSPDKATAVMIYVHKQPPEFVRNEGLFLDGIEQDGVPYFGEPLRGGVRVYLDDRFAAYIKRQDLPVAQAETLPDGQLRWKLYPFLRSQGVDTATIVEGYVVRHERWQEKLTAAELEPIAFQASSQAKGEVTLGDQKTKVQSLMLFSRPLAPSELPSWKPEEEM